MKFEVNIEGSNTELEVNEENIAFTLSGELARISFEDIIGVEESENEDDSFNLYYIQQQSENKLSKEKVIFTAENGVFGQLRKTITSKIWAVTERPKKVVIFVNAVGGHGQGKQICDDIVVPVLTLAGIQTEVIVSQRASHATEFAETYDFTHVNGVVIMGGDGTVSDICNSQMISTQKNAGVDLNDPNSVLKTMELPIAFIPTGSWNGIVNVFHGCKDVLTSTLHIVKGNKRKGNLLGNFSDGKLIGYATFCSAYAIQHEIAQAIIDYRWIGYSRGLLALLWYVLIRPYREVDVEITYEYLDKNWPDDMPDEEKASQKFIERKKIINLLALTYDFDFEDNSSQQQVQKDQFDLLDYKMCSRSALWKHYINFGQILTKEHRDDAKDFIQYSKIKAFRLRALDENSTTNYFYNIDGEPRKLKTPDVYVKLFPRCFTVFSSYNGPTKWR